MSEQDAIVEKATSRLDTAEFLFENGKYETAVSEAYYAMFHAAKALLLTEESRPKTHAGTATELGNLFQDRMDRELLAEFSRIRQLREDADYEIDTDIDREIASDAVETAGRFLSEATDLLDAE